MKARRQQAMHLGRALISTAATLTALIVAGSLAWCNQSALSSKHNSHGTLLENRIGAQIVAASAAHSDHNMRTVRE